MKNLRGTFSYLSQGACALLVISLFVSMPWGTTPVAHAVSATMNYQGKLTTSANVAVPDGTYNMHFWLIASSTAPTSTAVWTETRTGGDRVQVTNGLFSVMLGSVASLSGVDFSQGLYLGVEIGGTGGSPVWDGEMLPRKTVGTVPAAFVAATSTFATTASTSNFLSGIASSSFLRSDQDDSALGLLTFTGGFVSSASSTIINLTTSVATTTTLVINNSPFTSLTGTGLTNNAGVLSVATSSLGFGSLAWLSSVDISANTNLGVTATGLSLSGDNVALTAGYTIPLTASTTEWASAYASTTAFTPTYIRGLFSNTATGLTYNSGTGATSLTAGYTIPLTASTTEWANKVSSQWITNGANIYYNTGNVGIGTSTPGMKVDAYLGSVSNNTSNFGYNVFADAGGAVGYSGYNLFLNNSTANASGYFRLARTAGTTFIGMEIASQSRDGFRFLTGTTTPAEVLRITADGNLGIGTTTPGYALTVAGDTNITGALRFNGDAGTAGQILMSNGASAPTWNATSSLGINSSQWTTNGADIYYNTGNVGIGTSTPPSKLTVTGDLFLIGIASSTGLRTGSASTSDLTVSGSIYVPNTIRFPGVGSVSTLTRAGNHTLTLTTTATTNATIPSGTVTLADLSSTQTFSGAKTFSNSTVTFSGSTATLSFSSATGNKTVSTGGTTNLILSPGGNVGIGTTTPSAKLHITGTAGSGDIFAISSSTNARLLTVTAQGYLGIGTTTPSHLLTVAGDTNITGTLRFNGDAGTAGQILMSNGASAPTWNATSSLGLRESQWTTNGADIYYNTGNVGIGTSTPYAALSIGNTSGTALSDGTNSTWSGGFNLNVSGPVPDNNYLATIGHSGSSERVNGLFIKAGKSGDPQYALRIQATDATDLFSVQASGRIGIGTSSPSSLLNIGSESGTLLTDGSDPVSTLGVNVSVGNVVNGDYIMGLGSANSRGGGLFIKAGNADGTGYPLRIQNSAGTEILAVRGTGKVGVGTTTPFAALSVGNLSGTDATDASGRGVDPAGLLVHINTGVSKYAAVFSNDSGNNAGVLIKSKNTQLNVVDQSNVSSLFVNSGKVGILNNNPYSILSVGALATTSISDGLVSGGSVLNVRDSISGQYAAAIQNANSNSHGLLIQAGDLNNHQFFVQNYTGNTTYFAVAGGKSAFGTSSPKNILDIAGGAVIGSSYAGVNTAPTDGLLIQGKLGIGTTTPQQMLHVVRSDDGPPVRFQDSNGYCEMDPTTTTWTCTSDARLKKDIESLDTGTVLADLSKLRAVSFRWKKDTDSDEKRTGLIAQEVEAIFPNLVTTDASTGYKAVSYGGFTAYLIAGVDELAQENTQLASLLATGTSTFATSSPFYALVNGQDTIWSRMVKLAQGFVDGILTIAGVHTDELCVGDVCVDQATFLKMVQNAEGTPTAPQNDQNNSGGDGGDIVGPVQPPVSSTTTDQGGSGTTTPPTDTGTTTESGGTDTVSPLSQTNTSTPDTGDTGGGSVTQTQPTGGGEVETPEPPAPLETPPAPPETPPDTSG